MPASATRLNLRPTPSRVQIHPQHPQKTEADIRKHLEDAEIRRQEFLRDQKERVARDNEQRKRRVNHNRMLKQQEKDKEAEERRKFQERIRQFEEAQRSPKTPMKIAAMTPSRLLTPGQNAVPRKRSKNPDEMLVF
jgi:hypothetical protein